MNIFETLSKLSPSLETKRKPACLIYRDEKDGQIKEIPLSKLDSAGSALINKVMKQSPAKLIHDSIFG